MGDRMKDFESVTKTRLISKLPVLARLDGKAFHTFTRKMLKPYDQRFHECMWAAATYLCNNVEGCQVAYVQSDEITLLLSDRGSVNTQPWFGNELQKLCSVSAAMASVSFYQTFLDIFGVLPTKDLPVFDARFWNLPDHEVSNVFLWRQRDAERNSLSMQAQALFSHKELEGKSSADRHDLLHSKGVNWNDLPTPVKRGVCVVKEKYEPAEGIVRSRWVVDKDIPIFSTPEGREYIERFIRFPVP